MGQGLENANLKQYDEFGEIWENLDQSVLDSVSDFQDIFWRKIKFSQNTNFKLNDSRHILI